MTFAILGVCKRTGKVGFCQTTSTPAVGPRCADVVPGRGVFTVQASSDYRQKQLAAKLMEFGYSPAKVLKELSESDVNYEYRQTAILDLDGNLAVHTGANNNDWAGHAAGLDHVAIGNTIVGPGVVKAMSESFITNKDVELEERLVRSIEAGRDAGGQADGQVSSALLVYGDHPFPIVNLRVDVSLEPVNELRKIFNWYAPLMDFYIKRTLEPGAVTRLKVFLKEKGLPSNPYNA